MTQNNVSRQTIHPSSMMKPILIGSGIAAALIIFFLSGVDHPGPAWGTMWKLKPLIMVPFAGAIGGGFFYFMGMLSNQGIINRVVAIIVGLIGYVVVLWLGTVLGLNGTLWN